MTRQDPGSEANSLRSLLSALATGGRDRPISLEEWEDHLLSAPAQRSNHVTGWFLDALREEWQDASPPTLLCAVMTDEAYDYLSSRRGPWATVWGHIQRVAGNALWLAERSSFDPEAAYLAAIYHDLGKLDEWDTGTPHARLGAHHAARNLAEEIPAAKLDKITRAILLHPERPPISWRVARILHDADKLDKIGATGLLRRVSLAEDLEDAWAGADRMLYDLEMLPDLCFSAAEALAVPKKRFSQRLADLMNAADE